MDDTLPPRKVPRSARAPAIPERPEHSEHSERPGAVRADDETQAFSGARERLGAYLVEAKVGEGGMGKVYRCHDPSLKRAVAIKVLHDRYSRDEYYQARFRREAETLASLSHPSIAQIFAIDTTTDDALFIVMEYVEGRSIDDVLRSDGVLAIRTAVALAAEVAEGLRAAFERGVIHRDIKPSNLLLRPDGHVKIVDFGLSKELRGDTRSITEEGIVLGTPHYLSPEQGRGIAVDERSDIYSLGSTLYHMVTGSPPFEGKSQIAVIVSHVESDPRPPHDIRRDTPRELTAVIGRMMARDPANRYATYEELIEDLRQVERGEKPAHAREDSGRFPVRTPSSPRRRRRMRALSMLALLAFLALGVLGGWLVARTSDTTRRFAHAARLGTWYRARQDGGAVFVLDFTRAPADATARLDDAFLIRRLAAAAPGSGTTVDAGALGQRPSIDPHSGTLVWETCREPIAWRYPFARLDEAQLVVERVSGHVDWMLAVVDPLGSKRRRLVVRVDSSQPTEDPLVAERYGDLVPLDPAPPPLPPLLRFPLKLILECADAGGSTRVTLQVIALADGDEIYRHEGLLPGDDWANGAVILKTSFARAPFTLAMSEIVLAGQPSGERLEEVPWQD